ncbi:MAG: hypothetical protein B6I38_08200 [Anaerolineaceae bacterium 4572_5.1]|nr:MAG: hypothetical protein B6I38_08200 [Anaerolineaceae bacterium 4572_5.1]
MPTTNFPEYAKKKIKNVLDTLIVTGEAALVNIQIDQRSALRGFIAGVLQFEDDSELHFREFIDTSSMSSKLMYANHYQDKSKTLIFRYDNAAHRPKLTQMDHKHTSAGVEISSAPSLAQVVDEILKPVRS